MKAAPAGYELLDEIGRGGMGVVYRARDIRIDRDVAVKLLQDRFSPNSISARRFLEEARITGQLQHPGIPAVHQFGTLPDGRPFLAMKLIKGQTLDELLASRPRQRAGSALRDHTPADADDTPNLIAVFEQVCQAVAYAHAHGVIHRDLKPANVMVGAFGEVQVMDWGLAKVLGVAVTRSETSDPDATLGTEIRSTRDANEATQAGSLLGTPSYMSPEQAIGAVDQIDARSDVFGLGAILCAILTGQPPYVAADSEAVRQLAARAKLDDALYRLAFCGAESDLTALCERCLSVEKADRPADAGVVAKAVAGLRAAADERARQADLHRAAAAAEAREQRKRRKVQLALAAAVGLLLAGGGAFAWWEDKQATARRVEADNRDRDEQERLARNSDALANLVGQCEDALRADDADQAAVALDQIERRLPEGGGDAVRARAERCRVDLAMLRELDGIDAFRWSVVEKRHPNWEAIAARLQVAFAGYGVALDTIPAGAAARKVTTSLVRDRLLAALDLMLVREPSPGVRAILRAADPDPYRDITRDALAARDRLRVTALAERPEALAQPPWFAAALGQHESVSAELRLKILMAALWTRPGDFGLLMTLGSTSRFSLLRRERDPIRWYQAAVSVRPRNASAHIYLGSTLGQANDYDGAIACYREAIRLDPSYASAHNHLGGALNRKGDRDGAVACYKEAIRLDPTDWTFHSNLGFVLQNRGDLDGTLACFREAVRLNPKDAKPHSYLGRALVKTGDLDGSVACFREAVRLNQKDAEAHYDLGLVLVKTGDMAGATAAFKKATSLLRPNPLLNWEWDLVWVLATGPDGARDGRRAVEFATRACERTSWKRPDYIDTLAAAYAEVGDFDKAVEYQKKALSFYSYTKAEEAAGRQRLALYARKVPYRDPALARREVAPPPRAAK